MKNKLRAYPLITIDPYFSYWSFKEKLNKEDTRHWTGKITPMVGEVIVDNKAYTFLGKGKILINQTKRTVTPLFTTYTFRNEQIELEVSFWSPMFLDKPELFSRPCSYIDFKVTNLDNTNPEVKIKLSLDESFVYNNKKDSKIYGDELLNYPVNIAYMSKRRQPLLETSGDDLRINWGYLFVSGSKDNSKVEFKFNEKRSSLNIEVDLTNKKEDFVVVSYDDVVSLNYFGDVLTGYWKTKYNSITDAIVDASNDHDELKLAARKLDKDILKSARKSGGKALEVIVTASYRQSISAHKACQDKEGKIIFISKENFSNGCAATVDVTYPSIPLYLIYNPELVLGMARPILKNANMPSWIYDFAPHDAGRYPLLVGNVYGMNDQYKGQGVPNNDTCVVHNDEVHPPYYYYNKEKDIFDDERQMPVEECGNMLILVYAACELLNDKETLLENYDNFTKWVKYLIEFGQDPGNQLCTDDFAGHLAHNANLAVKSILGIEAYALINKFLGKEDIYNEYHKLAQEFAKDWEKRANRGDHTCLTFDKEEGWSLKYNLIWDRYFGSKLFSEELFEKETSYYLTKLNEYGIPLDSRKEYTKTDWEVWVTALTDDLTKREAIYKGIENFINKSKSRAPFSDWHETVTGLISGFRARSVQGGCFASIMMDKRRS